MERLLVKTGVLVAMALLAVSVQAQLSPPPAAPLEPAEPPAPQYRIEVIVFAYNEADPSEEIYRPRPVRSGSLEALTPGEPLDLAPFDLDALTNLNAPQAAGDAAPGGFPPRGAELEEESANAQQETGGQADPDFPGTSSTRPPSGEFTSVTAGSGRSGTASTPFRFRLLESEELQLNDAYSRLQRLDAYTPLLHGGWIQDGLPENQARPFDIAYLGTFNPAGTIRLHVSRFLHLSLDMDYRPTALQRAARPADDSQSFGLSELSLGPRHVLATSRRVRSGELNYFDHPYFGLIVVVTPYEPTPEMPEEGAGPAA
jgi:hypothetical protein